MKPFVFAAAFYATSNLYSLGVGLHVLPEAYTFAASRLDFNPILHLTRCDLTTCRWDVGNGIELTARLAGDGLDINKIEADFTYKADAEASKAQVRFEKACLAIIALVVPDMPSEETRKIARSISLLPEERMSVDIAKSARGIGFYGRRESADRKSGVGEIKRCGVLATSTIDPTP